MPNKEVIRQTLDLLETMEEGMDHVKVRLGELNIEGNITVLTDLITAFTEVEKGITPMLEDLPENNIIKKSDKLRKAFDIMVKEYESNKAQKTYEVMQITLQPSFKSWKEEMELTLRPHIAS